MATIPLLEVCVDNFESVKATVDGGGTRIELCSSLSVNYFGKTSLKLLFLGRRTYSKLRVLEICQTNIPQFDCISHDKT